MEQFSSKMVGFPGDLGRSGKADSRTESISRYGGEQADVKLRPIVVSHREYESRIPFRIGFSLLLCLLLQSSTIDTLLVPLINQQSTALHLRIACSSSIPSCLRATKFRMQKHTEPAEAQSRRSRAWHHAQKMNCHSFLPIVKRKSPQSRDAKWRPVHEISAVSSRSY